MQACRVLRATARVPLDHARSFADRVATTTELSQLLRNAAALLPRVDPSHFWTGVLDRSIAELDAGPGQVPSKATIVISGVDKWARTQDLVTALLEDPFTSDAAYSDILRNRWKNTPSYINIGYGKPAAFATELSSPSDWLRRFPHPIQLTELPDLSSLSSISDETNNLLLSSDVLLLLCDPIVTPLPDLASQARHLLDKPNTILVLTSGSASDSHCQFVSTTLSKLGCRPGRVLFVDPGQALDAVTALQADPTSPSTIDRYQRDTLGSRISTVPEAISEVLSPKSTSMTHFRQGTALSQVYACLSAGFRSAEAARAEADHVVNKVEELSSAIKKAQEDAMREIFGRSEEDDKVEKALSSSAKEMSALLGSLTFWKMVWRIDEIGALVSAAIQGQWCKGLESQLVLQTGRLEFVQREMSSSAFGLVSSSSSPSLRSSLLENMLEQLKHSPSHVLTTDSLARPIHDRRSQLIQHTTTKLHREAQGAVIGAFGGVLSGAGLGWWLAFGEHILSLGAGTEMGTAIGSGALIAVGGIRWAVGKWERAKQRWTRDSARVRQGLARDLRATVQRTVDERVIVVASTACKGMQDLVDRRCGEINQLHEELRDLNAELRIFTPEHSPHPVKKASME